jgi:hypothetical protein
MIRVIKEQAGQDFFRSGNRIPNSLKAESTIIARNATKKNHVKGFAVQEVQEKMKMMRYQIIATDTMMFTRYANTPHNGGEPVSDMKINHVMISYLILLFFVSMSIRSFLKENPTALKILRCFIIAGRNILSLM